MTSFASPAADSLPANVLDALRHGNNIEAIKRLRETTGLGLKEAKDVIDQHARGLAVGMTPVAPASTLPPAVAAALRRGNKIDAIKLLREHTGLGLKEAKDAIDAFHLGARTRDGKLGPGEVSRSTSAVWWMVAIAVAGVAAYYFLPFSR